MTIAVNSRSASGMVTNDDLSREAYCMLGMPIDVIEMTSVLQRLEFAALSRAPFFLSTANLNFLANARTDPEFRESLLQSDLCTADGISIVWIAWLLGIPIKHRIAGSDILLALKNRNYTKPLKLFLFGGDEGVGAAASHLLNAQPLGVYCVGSLYPGFGSLDEMSKSEIIDVINSSDADFLVVSLGAKKGQSWLMRNHLRLRSPVRSHLGASLNFEAGKIRRAPRMVQKMGLEWLWRIKEEPYLWRRYWDDARTLLKLLHGHILPLMIYRLNLKYQTKARGFLIKEDCSGDRVIINISGPAVGLYAEEAIAVFRQAIASGKQLIINFSDTSAFDTRFLGALLMLRKQFEGAATKPVFAGLSPGLKRIFRLNGLSFLYASDGGA